MRERPGCLGILFEIPVIGGIVSRFYRTDILGVSGQVYKNEKQYDSNLGGVSDHLVVDLPVNTQYGQGE